MEGSKWLGCIISELGNMIFDSFGTQSCLIPFCFTKFCVITFVSAFVIYVIFDDQSIVLGHIVNPIFLFMFCCPMHLGRSSLHVLDAFLCFCLEAKQLNVIVVFASILSVCL